MNRSIAIFQNTNNHEEVIYPQIVLLRKAGYQVHLVANEVLLKKDLFDHLQPDVHTLPLPRRMNFLQKLRAYAGVRAYLRRNGVERIIFNTAEGTSTLLLCLILGKRVCKTGILHNADKLGTLATQRWLSRCIPTYLVLADHVLANIPAAFQRRNRFESFYPVFFDLPPAPPAAGGEHVTLCIPGQIDQRRRDYLGLLHMLAHHRQKLPDNLRFILLGNVDGNDGPQVLKQIRRSGLERHFLTFNGFVPYRDFFNILAASDMVMPLCHPGQAYFSDYLHSKIMGAFNLAYAFRKPLLMFQAFEAIEDFHGIARFYRTEPEDLPRVLAELCRPDRAALRTLTEGYNEKRKFSLPVQLQKYLRIIES